MHNLDVVQEGINHTGGKVQSPGIAGIGLYFSIDQSLPDQNYLALLKKAVQYADRMGISFAWVMDERNHKSGGAQLNPSIIPSALSVQTTAIALRGQCLSPDKRDAIRSIEDWSIVDNLSNGRIGILISPEEKEHLFGDVMKKHITELRSLWRGDTVKRINGVGNEVELRVFPKPIQKELPIWVLLESADADINFIQAGELGFHILVAGDNADQNLQKKIAQYKKAVSASVHTQENCKVTFLVDSEKAGRVAELYAGGANEIAFRLNLAAGNKDLMRDLENLVDNLKMIDPS